MLLSLAGSPSSLSGEVRSGNHEEGMVRKIYMFLSLVVWSQYNKIMQKKIGEDQKGNDKEGLLRRLQHGWVDEVLHSTQTNSPDKFVSFFFSTKDVTIGPTAIMAIMTGEVFSGDKEVCDNYFSNLVVQDVSDHVRWLNQARLTRSKRRPSSWLNMGFSVLCLYLRTF